MNRRHYSDCAPDGRSTGLQHAIAVMVQQIARISKEGGRRPDAVQAADQENSKFSGLRAPATNFQAFWQCVVTDL
jgi:hypothetical protein